MKLLLLGATGQLGTDLQEALRARSARVTALSHAQLELWGSQAVAEAIAAEAPDVVINTAAFHKVEECERQPERAFALNAVAVGALAGICQRNKCVLVHFSTDYVFDGEKRSPYSETDLPRPLSVYAASKLAGEHLVASAMDRYILVRTCGLYGRAGSRSRGGNFVEIMLKRAAQGVPIRVVDDQVLTPTYTADLAQKVCQILETSAFGLLHVSGEGQCSWYEFARKIFELSRLEADLAPVRTADFASPVRRPAYSVLSKAKLASMKIPAMPPWEDALARYLQSRRGFSPDS